MYLVELAKVGSLLISALLIKSLPVDLGSEIALKIVPTSYHWEGSIELSFETKSQNTAALISTTARCVETPPSLESIPGVSFKFCSNFFVLEALEIWNIVASFNSWHDEGLWLVIAIFPKLLYAVAIRRTKAGRSCANDSHVARRESWVHLASHANEPSKIHEREDKAEASRNTVCCTTH